MAWKNHQTRKAGAPYKYRLHDLLYKLPKDDFDVAMKFFPQRIGITKGTFRNWIYTREDAQHEMPASALLIIADFFQIHPSEVFTNPPIIDLSIVEGFKQYKLEL